MHLPLAQNDMRFEEIAVRRQQRDRIGGTFSMMSAAMKVMQHQQQLEAMGQNPEEVDVEAQAEQLRLMLDAMWASNALDIQTTVTRVCQQVRYMCVLWLRSTG